MALGFRPRLVSWNGTASGSIDECEDMGLAPDTPELQALDPMDPFVRAIVQSATDPESHFTILFEMFEPSLSAADGTKVWVEWFDSLAACRDKLEAIIMAMPT